MRLRVLRLERVDVRGEAITERAVFCPARKCSMPLDECRRCLHFERADDSLLECKPDVLESAERASSDDSVLGGDVRVGEVMGGPTVLIPIQTPFRAALEALTRATSGHALVGVVVDTEGVVVGTIEHPDAGFVEEIDRSSEAARAVAPVRESATLGAAVERMVKERRRFLPVVDDSGHVVGLISDLDALHWVASRSSSSEER
jgi:CBS domain-containing protein